MQIWIEIGFDSTADEFTLKYLSVEVDRIRERELSEKLFKHKVVKCSTKNYIKEQHHTIYQNVRYVTTSTFYLKTKRCELQHGKAKAIKRGHNIDDPAGYPVPLKCTEDIDWNISL